MAYFCRKANSSSFSDPLRRQSHSHTICLSGEFLATQCMIRKHSTVRGKPVPEEGRWSVSNKSRARGAGRAGVRADFIFSSDMPEHPGAVLDAEIKEKSQRRPKSS